MRADERLLWSRDIRFVRRLAAYVEGGRLLELETGTVLIGPADSLTDGSPAEVADAANAPDYGLVAVDGSLPERDRYLVAMSAAVQLSGLADRIGMAQSTQVVQTKMLDYFFSLRKLHGIAFQPIVALATGTLYEYECLFRPNMPMLPQSISVGRPGGDQHGPRRRARHLHRRDRPRAGRAARGGGHRRPASRRVATPST